MAYQVDKTEPVMKFKKSMTDEVHVDIVTNKGKKFINIRVFYQDEFSNWNPGKQGMTLSINKIDDLEEMVKKLREKIPKGE